MMKMPTGVARVAAVVLFFAGLFFLSQAYTLAFHGLYLDCLHSGCAPRHYDEPTLTAVLYGSVLAIGALLTFYAGLAALRSSRR
jgi:hypothetical protein